MSLATKKTIQSSVTRALVYICLLLCASIRINCAFAEQSTHAELKQIDQKIDQQQERITIKQQSQTQAQKKLKQTEQSIAKASRKVFDLKRAITKQQTQLKGLQSEQQTLNKQKLVQEKIIIEQINTSFRLGREKKIKMMLNQEDPSQLSRMLIYSDYFNKARLESIEEYQATVERLEALKPDLEAKTQTLLNNKNALVAEQRQLEKDFQSRSEVLSTINKELAGEQEKLKALQEDQKRLQKLLKQVEVAVTQIQLPSDSTPFSKMKRKLPWPVKGSYEKRFGKKYQGGSLKHEGDAFYAPLGRSITAIHYGQVVFADWFRGKGFLLIIDHGEGYMSLYAHNQSLLRDAGDWVSQGEQIATLGNTGGLDHAELYFEIRKSGKPQNPKYWFKKR